MKRKNIVIFISIIFIVLIVLTLLFIYFKTDLIKKNIDLTTAKSRKNYIITDDKNLSNYINKDEKTLVIFWATWCSYCLEESNELNEYIKSNPYKSIIVVSHDDNKDDVVNYLEENGYNWFVILDPEKTIRENIDPGSSGIPSSYLLNSDMNILNFHKGKLSIEQFVSFYNELEIQ